MPEKLSGQTHSCKFPNHVIIDISNNFYRCFDSVKQVNMKLFPREQPTEWKDYFEEVLKKYDAPVIMKDKFSSDQNISARIESMFMGNKLPIHHEWVEDISMHIKLFARSHMMYPISFLLCIGENIFPHATQWHRDIYPVQDRLIFTEYGNTTEFVDNCAWVRKEFEEWPIVQNEAKVHSVPPHWLSIIACGDSCIAHRIPPGKRIVVVCAGIQFSMF